MSRRSPWGQSGPLLPFAALSATYFAHIGFFNPYLPLWLKSLGLSVGTIGVMTAMQSLSRVVAPYFWGWLSDRTGERVMLLRFCAAAAGVCSFGLFVPFAMWWLVLVLLVMFIHTSAMMPMSEAALAQWVSTKGAFDTRRYGRIRLWGSMGFLVTVMLSGAWFEAHGMRDFAMWAVGSLVLLNLAVWWLPHQREAAHAQEGMASVREVLRQRTVQWFFAALFFHVLSHIGVYVFFSLYLDELGYSKTMIGSLWAVSVLVEIGWFFTQSRWLPMWRPTQWLLLCALAMALRMTLTAWWADALQALVFAQALHALTFATHHTVCIGWLSEHFPGRLRGRGQALYASLGYGVPGVLGALSGGAISEVWGLSAVYECSVATACLSALCAWRCGLARQRAVR
jgi:PPP family 3-phenylpropionic acid transporter